MQNVVATELELVCIRIATISIGKDGRRGAEEIPFITVIAQRSIFTHIHISSQIQGASRKTN